MDQFTGSLEGFLRRIQIDDTLRLMPECHCLASVEQEDLDMETSPNFLEHQDMLVEDVKDAVWDLSGLPSPVVGMATTSSDFHEDVRMEEVIPVQIG